MSQQKSQSKPNRSQYALASKKKGFNGGTPQNVSQQEEVKGQRQSEKDGGQGKGKGMKGENTRQVVEDKMGEGKEKEVEAVIVSKVKR